MELDRRRVQEPLRRARGGNLRIVAGGCDVVTDSWSRVIVITPCAGGADGVSAVTRLWVNALAARIDAGIGALTVWSFEDVRRPDGIEDARVRFESARRARLRFAGMGLRADGIDDRTLVIVQHVHLLPVALPLTWRGARLLLLLHGVEAWKPLRTLEAAGCRQAWKIVAVSAHTAARFRAANPSFADRRIDICPPGLPSRGGSAGLQGCDQAEQSGGAALQGCESPYALIVGRMASTERYKGHDSLIESWPRIRSAVPAARLVVVGGGDDRERLEGKATALGLNGSVRFEGVVTHERLAALYRDAAVFVMPSANEGFGLVYIEAMAAGTPCIVASGAAEEIVENGTSGVVIAPGDGAAMERALVRLMTDHDERARMGDAAARTVSERFSADAFARRLYDLVQLSGKVAAC